MFVIADSMSLITPDFGLFFWTVLIFILLWVLLGKFAFRPIISALRKREDTIDDALRLADKTKEEMAALKADHEVMMQEAREERGRIIREAKETGDDLVNQAKARATAEAAKIVQNATTEIEHKKLAALTEVKNTLGHMTLEIAEKILRRELDDRSKQEAYIGELIDKSKLN